MHYSSCNILKIITCAFFWRSSTDSYNMIHETKYCTSLMRNRSPHGVLYFLNKFKTRKIIMQTFLKFTQDNVIFHFHQSAWHQTEKWSIWHGMTHEPVVCVPIESDVTGIRAFYMLFADETTLARLTLCSNLVMIAIPRKNVQQRSFPNGQ